MPLGHDGRLFLLTVEPADPVPGGPTGPSDLVGVLLDAVDHARGDTGVAARDFAVRVGAGSDPQVAKVVADRGATLVVAAEDHTRDRFALAHGDDFGRHIEQLAPDLTSVSVRWHPDDAPELKKAQALGLTRLVAWLHETERELLVDLAVPPTADDLESVGGEVARDDREARPDRVRAAIAEIRELGTEADVWAVPAPADTAEAETLGALLHDADRDAVAALARVTSGDAQERIRAAATVDAYRGLVLGPELWATELGELAAGTRSRADAARGIGERLARTIDLYTAAPPA